MTPEQTALLQQSFDLLEPKAAEFTASFYNKLFELEPAARALFKNNMDEQGRKLIITLGTVVRGTEDATTFRRGVEKLGRQHAELGVVESDYPAVAQALLWALKHHLNSSFTPEVEAAWTEAYQGLAEIMIGAAK